jgi:hypothetical protein
MVLVRNQKIIGGFYAKTQNDSKRPGAIHARRRE